MYCYLAAFWPSGTYGLPKPKGGCPEYRNGTSWAMGWRKQDSEDDDDAKWNNISFGSHMDAMLIPGASVRTDIKRYFCVRKASGLKNISWPKGKQVDSEL